MIKIKNLVLPALVTVLYVSPQSSAAERMAVGEMITNTS
jgi:hypothetical protein